VAEGSRAIAPLLFDVVVFGQRRNSGTGAAQLPVFFENNFCASVVFFHLSVDLDHPALQLPHIAHAFQVTGKDHDGKWAQAKVVAEVQKMNTSRPLLDPYHHADYALDLAHVVLGFREGEAIRAGKAAHEGCKDQHRRLMHCQ